MMLASGISSVITMLVGRTTRELGAMPIVHIKVAPIQTCIGIMRTPAPLWLPGILAEREANAMERWPFPDGSQAVCRVLKNKAFAQVPQGTPSVNRGKP